jgi:MYXO-CTERM domain-containing protein
VDSLDWVIALMEAAPLVPVTIFTALLTLGALFGGRRRRALHASIRDRERREARPVITAYWIDETRVVERVEHAVSTVVVSIDYFRRTVASLRRLWGGEIALYSTLLDMARREAIQRMCAQHADAHAFVGCRIVTSGLEEGGSRVEVIVWSSAVTYAPPR